VYLKVKILLSRAEKLIGFVQLQLCLKMGSNSSVAKVPCVPLSPLTKTAELKGK